MSNTDGPEPPFVGDAKCLKNSDDGQAFDCLFDQARRRASVSSIVAGGNQHPFKRGPRHFFDSADWRFTGTKYTHPHGMAAIDP